MGGRKQPAFDFKAIINHFDADVLLGKTDICLFIMLKLFTVTIGTKRSK